MGMSATSLDTLAVARDLEAAGVDRRQAEAHAEALRQAVSAGRDELATGADIARIDGSIAAVRTELGIIRWVVGIQSAITLATFAIVAAKLL